MASHCERLETRYGPNDGVCLRLFESLPQHALWGQAELMCNFQSETSTNLEKYTELCAFYDSSSQQTTSTSTAKQIAGVKFKTMKNSASECLRCHCKICVQVNCY